jgi:hypothetical protein
VVGGGGVGGFCLFGAVGGGGATCIVGSSCAVGVCRRAVADEAVGPYPVDMLYCTAWFLIQDVAKTGVPAARGAVGYG